MSQLVLIVDDHFDNRAIYRSILVHLGYEVVEAVDGDEAIAMATSRHPDVVLMDMTLPGRDGWSATRVLKAAPATAGIPIIALTAHATEADRQKALAAGCDSYLPKPAVPRVVADEVARLIGERKAGGAEASRAGESPARASSTRP